MDHSVESRRKHRYSEYYRLVEVVIFRYYRLLYFKYNVDMSSKHLSFHQTDVLLHILMCISILLNEEGKLSPNFSKLVNMFEDLRKVLCFYSVWQRSLLVTLRAMLVAEALLCTHDSCFKGILLLGIPVMEELAAKKR